jgi:hypothetical protein
LVLRYTVGRALERKPYVYKLEVLRGYNFIEVEKYKRTGAQFRALTLAVRVIKSNDKRCRRGKIGRVVIKENFAREDPTGRLVDSVQSTICGRGVFYTRKVSARIIPAWGAPLG